MLISSTSPSLVQPPLLPDDQLAPKANAQPDATTSASPAVVVTLSQDAKEALAKETTPADAAKVLRDQLSQAAAALNDTSDSASADDQLKAFKMISQTLLHGPAADGQPDSNLEFAAALVGSPFAQRLNQVFSYMASQNTIDSSADPFAERAEVGARTLAAFDSLSETDQQLYVGAQAFHTETTYELPWVRQSGAVIQSPDDFRANLKAQIQVDQALGAAIDDPRYVDATLTNGRVQNDTDARVLALGKLAAAAGDEQMTALTDLRYSRNSVDWTARAEAYLEKYGQSAAPAPSPAAPAPFVAKPTGPNPDTQRVLSSIATLNDPRASIDDKMAALDVKPLKNNPASTWVLAWMSERSAFAKAVDSAGSALMNQMMSMGRSAQAGGDDVPPNGAEFTLSYLDGRSDDEQRLAARAYGYGDVASWKADLQNQAAAFADQYGDTGAKASTRMADKASTTALNALERAAANQKQFIAVERARRVGEDPDTGAAATKVDPKSAQALATLSQIIDNLQSFAEAERARYEAKTQDQDAQRRADRRPSPGAQIDATA